MKISVIICAHNPRIDFLTKVLESLKNQTLDMRDWELIIVDNGSKSPIMEWLRLDWHPEHKIIIENNLGLINARIRGVIEAVNPVLVSVDDDTPLDKNYLKNVQLIYQNNPDLGVIGGKTIPLFESPPPEWLSEFHGALAIRDLGDKVITQKKEDNSVFEYPECAPLLIAPKRESMLKFIEYFKQSQVSKELGRKGNSLASGEDNDINLFIFKEGYTLGYFPQLVFYHIIPKERMSPRYLSKLMFSMNRTWIKVLTLYKINPWQAIPAWTLHIRCLKAFFLHRAWKAPENHIRWKAACGLYKGLSEI